jgi:hypothetical protein
MPRPNLRKPHQSDNQIVDSSFTAIINAPISKIDIPAWAFGLSEREYKGCSTAHIAAGLTTAPDGKRMALHKNHEGRDQEVRTMSGYGITKLLVGVDGRKIRLSGD